MLNPIRLSARIRRAGHRWASRVVRSERGAVLVMAAFGFVAVLALVGVSVDVGKVLTERREMQNAADAAALAGAGVLLDGGSATAARGAASSWASRYGAGISASVATPPTSGSHAGDANCVQVRVSETVSDFFMPMLSAKGVAAAGTACITTQPRNYGVITLNRTDCNASYYNGSLTLTVTNGGTFTNSECAVSALYVNGSAVINTEANDVVGGSNVSGGSISPPPTRAKHLDDPLAGLAAPAPPAGPILDCPHFVNDTSYTLEPGVYNCKIDPKSGDTVTFNAGNYLIRDGINLNSSGSVTFNAGVYTLGGTGFKVNGNANVTSIGATFYIQDGAAIDMNGTGVGQMRAPTTGTYAGVLFFQSRSNTATVSINGNAAHNGWGAVYAPSALVDYNGNSSTSFQVIADTFRMNGSATLDITFDDNFTAAVRRIKLVQE